MKAKEEFKSVVTVDGLASVGKSTVARKLASRLGFVHLNSGALFRAVALEVLGRGVDVGDEEAIAHLASELRFDFDLDEQGGTVFTVNGRNVASELGREKVSELSSLIAVLPKLRQILVDVQRHVARQHAIVLEGRDAGTVVFPEAGFKFYLDASLEVRAKRRFDELFARGEQVEYDEVARVMRERDHRDQTRAVAPSHCASDAEVIEVGNLTADEVVDRLYRKVQGGISGDPT